MENNQDELTNTVTPSTQQPKTEVTKTVTSPFPAATGNGQKPGEQQAAITNKISDNPSAAEIITNQPAEVETAEQTAEEESAAVEQKQLSPHSNPEQLKEKL